MHAEWTVCWIAVRVRDVWAVREIFYVFIVSFLGTNKHFTANKSLQDP